VCGRRGRRTRVCEAAWENTREKREEGRSLRAPRLGQDSSDMGCRESHFLLYCGAFWGAEESVCFLGVQTRGKKEMELLFIFTRSKHGNKISFGDTEDFIGGVGRSPLDI